MANLQTHIPLDQVDAVVITHEHPDHWTDLEALGIAFKWGLRKRGPAVFAPSSIRGMMRIGQAVEAFTWTSIDQTSKIMIGDIRISFSRTDHSVPTFAVQAEFNGRRVGYSADTGPAWSLSALGTGLNLAICEASFLHDREGTVQHLSARQAGRSAAAAGVDRLVITHLMPGVDHEAARLEAEEAFGGPVDVARVGVTYTT
jgi:ribonuclease BN (tRNA processing enzyme)